MDHEHGAAHTRAHRARVLLARPGHGRLLVREDQRLRPALEPPLDAVLDLLRRMRLGDLLGEEELEEAAVVAAPVVQVALRPALVRVERHVRRVLAVVRVRQRQPGHERRDRGDAEHGRRIGRGEHQRPAAAVAEAAHERVLGAARPQRGPTVGDVLPPGVGRCVAGTVGPAVPPRVERDDAEVAREVRDLRLPEPRVRDRRGREEQERRRRVPVDLVEDAHAVALDEALLVGVARTALLAGGGGDAHRSRSTNS